MFVSKGLYKCRLYSKQEGNSQESLEWAREGSRKKISGTAHPTSKCPDMRHIAWSTQTLQQIRCHWNITFWEESDWRCWAERDGRKQVRKNL